MEPNDLPYPDHSDAEVLQIGKRFGYGRWLQPIINSNDGDLSGPDMQMHDHQDPIPPRRGRGRPRVTKPRDQSAIEKRRAQVREAQRTYQKRKDDAAATEKRRVDDLLQVLSDLCSDVEALLEVTSQHGMLDHNDEVASHLRHLWSSYDTAINSSCVKPELRLLQLKNDRRTQGHHQNQPSPNHMMTTEHLQGGPGAHTPPTDHPEHGDLSERALQICGINETTLLQPFMRVAGPNARIMGGRSIFDVVTERQAIFNNPKSHHLS